MTCALVLYRDFDRLQMIMENMTKRHGNAPALTVLFRMFLLFVSSASEPASVPFFFDKAGSKINRHYSYAWRCHREITILRVIGVKA